MAAAASPPAALPAPEPGASAPAAALEQNSDAAVLAAALQEATAAAQEVARIQESSDTALAAALDQGGDRLWLMVRVARMDGDCDVQRTTYDWSSCRDPEYRLLELLHSNGYPGLERKHMGSEFWEWLRSKRATITTCRQASSEDTARNACDPYDDLVLNQGRAIETALAVPDTLEDNPHKMIPIDQLGNKARELILRQEDARRQERLRKQEQQQ